MSPWYTWFPVNSPTTPRAWWVGPNNFLFGWRIHRKSCGTLHLKLDTFPLCIQSFVQPHRGHVSYLGYCFSLLVLGSDHIWGASCASFHLRPLLDIAPYFHLLGGSAAPWQIRFDVWLFFVFSWSQGPIVHSFSDNSWSKIPTTSLSLSNSFKGTIVATIHMAVELRNNYTVPMFLHPAGYAR